MSHAHAVASGSARSEGHRGLWIRAAIVVGLCLVMAAAWKWTPLRKYLDPEALSDLAAPYRAAWYAGPLVLLAFLGLEMILFPLLILVVVTGMAFGPWLGSAYALAGTMASGALGFWIGRWMGQDKVEKLLGPRAKKLQGRMTRNGILSVFVARKIPFPYTLVNLVMGASRLRFRDFMIGTLLGLGTMVVVAAILGDQVASLSREPSWNTVLIALPILLVPFAIAWALNRKLKRTSS